jgi:hypothetical protein
MFFESTLERRAQLRAFAHPGAVRAEEQQRLEYIDAAGRRTHHWFDLLLTTSREVIAIAVKPYDIAERSDFRTLLQLIAIQTPKHFADRVVLVTERNLPRDVVYNAELIHSVRLDPEPDVDEVVRAKISTIPEPLRINDLTTRCGIGGSAFRSVVRLIAAGEINLAHRGSRIAPSSLISFPAVGDICS